ncbi:MAG: HAMP domain-containing sensor histidine kinase [Bacteroidota bacterium]
MLLNRINNRLQASLIESGKISLNYSLTDLSVILREVVFTNRFLAKEKNQQLDLEIMAHPVMRMDRFRMEEIFDHLINNAIQFTPFGKNIQVRLLEHQGRIRVEIEDQGQGLSQADQERLFSRYVRLSTQSSGGKSSIGLGLSITKRLVELHGGQIWASSEGRHQGTTFIVEFEKF